MCACVWLHYLRVRSFTPCLVIKRLSRGNCKPAWSAAAEGPALGPPPARPAHNAIVKTQWFGPSFHSARKGKEKKKVIYFYYIYFFFLSVGWFHCTQQKLIMQNLNGYMITVHFWNKLFLNVTGCGSQLHTGVLQGWRKVRSWVRTGGFLLSLQFIADKTVPGSTFACLFTASVGTQWSIISHLLALNCWPQHGA